MSITSTPPQHFLSFLFCLIILTTTITSSTDTFIYGGCSQIKYTPGSSYEFSLNSLFASLVNSAMFSSYNNFTVSNPATKSQKPITGLFQCRGDLTNTECARCVAHSVSQIGSLCPNSAGGSLQLEGCFIKYDNTSFLGVEDKTAVAKKCGQSIFGMSDELTQRDAVLVYLVGKVDYFRVGASGNVRGVAQCVGDLSVGECQDCLSDAIGRLRNECSTSAWGDMFLGKCYARFSQGGGKTPSNSGKRFGLEYGLPYGGSNDDTDNADEIEKTLAILIGFVAVVFLFIVFLSFLRKLCEKRDGK